jgi:hypothetical protein
MLEMQGWGHNPGFATFNTNPHNLNESCIHAEVCVDI